MSIRKKVVWLPYDMDTGIGINNEGSLVFGYALEDIDQVGGADVYNGQQSVLWKNLREMFPNELKAMYRELRSDGTFSYATVERMFEEHQAKWPEAIFNEDAWFKYLAPLEEKNIKDYLPMLQGSKAEQRKWWLYNRFKYLDSKYNAGDALTDVITLRAYAKSNITLTPYADIYASIKFASYLMQERAQKGEEYEFECPLTDLNDTEIYIYTASQLADLGDLSGLQVGFAVFGYATKLQNLKLGDSDSEYDNQNMYSLSLGNNTLLKTLDVRNCSGLGDTTKPGHSQTTVDLSGCTNIEEVYFEGTNIRGLTLPNGGNLKKLHLPDTITNLTIRNQTAITEFVCNDFSNVTTLWLDNVSNAVDTLDILSEMAEAVTSEHIPRVRIFNFDWTFSDMDDVLDLQAMLNTMRGMDEHGDSPTGMKPQLYGTIHVPSAKGSDIASFNADYPYVTIDAAQLEANIYYYNYDRSQLLYTETVYNHGNGAYNGQPSRSSTAQYDFTFAGWSLTPNGAADANATKNVGADRDVYAAYTTTVRTYTVTFQNSNGTVLQTYYDVPYGSSVSYTGTTPVHPSDPTTYVFRAFEPDGTSITGNTTCVAQYRDTSSVTRKLITRKITSIENSEVSIVGQYAFYSASNLTAVSFPNATQIGSYAFYSCKRISSFYMPSVTTIGQYAFASCEFSTIDMPLVTSMGSHAFDYVYSLGAISFNYLQIVPSWAFTNCEQLQTASLPIVTQISDAAFMSCYSLQALFIPSAETIGSSAFYRCSSIASLNLPEVVSIYNDGFMQCSSLRDFSAQKLTSIGRSAFARCTSLESINLPNISYIGDSAFAYCTNLNTVVIRTPSSVAKLGYSNVFSSTAASLAIYVPDELVSSYRGATYWYYYSSRIKGISELPT